MFPGVNQFEQLLWAGVLSFLLMHLPYSTLNLTLEFTSFAEYVFSPESLQDEPRAHGAYVAQASFEFTIHSCLHLF